MHALRCLGSLSVRLVGHRRQSGVLLQLLKLVLDLGDASVTLTQSCSACSPAQAEVRVGWIHLPLRITNLRANKTRQCNRSELAGVPGSEGGEMSRRPTAIFPVLWHSKGETASAH